MGSFAQASREQHGQGLIESRSYMGKHAEDAVELGAVNRVHLDFRFSDNRRTAEAVLKEGDFAANLAWADLSQQNAVSLDAGASTAQQEERPAGRILVDEDVARIELHLAGASLDQHPVIGGNQIQWIRR